MNKIICLRLLGDRSERWKATIHRRDTRRCPFVEGASFSLFSESTAQRDDAASLDNDEDNEVKRTDVNDLRTVCENCANSIDGKSEADAASFIAF